MAKKDFYQTLGVSKSATDSEIKTAYRRLARKHHPDVDKSPGSAEKFKEISEAYQVLSDPSKRKTYDQFGADAFSPGAGRAGAYGNPFGSGFNPFGGAQGGPFGKGGFSYSWSSSGNQQDFVDPFDLFEQIFGMSGFGAEFAQGFRRRQSYQMDLSFDEAIRGTEKNIEIEERDNGRLSHRRMKIKVPAGVDSGTRMKFGDIDIIFRVTRHPDFIREGADIFSEATLSIPQIVLGDVFEVNTIDGKVKLRIPSGTEPGALVRIKGKGVPKLSGGRGDHYVRVKLEVPKNLSSKERELYEQLKSVQGNKKGWF